MPAANELNINVEHIERVAKELGLRAIQVGAAAKLLADGATVPFIARYRKEATGSLQQASEIIALCGDQIDVFSGDDFITFPMMACGAKGIISVLANIMPKEVGDLTDAFFAGDLAKARKIHLDTLKIGNAMFIESNPIPVKTALGLMGKCSDEVRLPLCPSCHHYVEDDYQLQPGFEPVTLSFSSRPRSADVTR